MGKIKTLIANELVGGTTTEKVYPVTSTLAVFDSNNNSLDTSLTAMNSVITTQGNNITNLESENSSLVKDINELENQMVDLEKINDNSSNVEFILHKVVKGESLTIILEQYNLEYSKYIKEVKLLNNISNIDVIKEGSIIVLPIKEN